MAYIQVILPNEDAEDALEALEEAGIRCDYIDNGRIQADEDANYGEVLDNAGIRWSDV